MADKKFGKKRVCTNCEVKFYDLNKKSPIACPHCKFEIIIEEEELLAIPTQRIEQTPKENVNEFEELDNSDDENDMISLDEAEEEEDKDSKN